MDYPADRLEIIAASDGSTDDTPGIVHEHEALGVRVLILSEHLGRTEAQNRAVDMTHQPILFFTDATTMHPPDALRAIVQPFADPTVGCVYAVRRDLYVPLRPDLVSDFVEPLELLACGYRTIFEPAVVGIVDRPPPGPAQEFSRRARIVVQGFRAILHVRALLDPRRDLLQAIRHATQRPLKWLTPFYALGVLASSVALAYHPGVKALLLAQVVFYGAAGIGWALEMAGVRTPRPLALPPYFTIICVAAVAGMVALLRAGTGRTWNAVCR